VRQPHPAVSIHDATGSALNVASSVPTHRSCRKAARGGYVKLCRGSAPNSTVTTRPVGSRRDALPRIRGHGCRPVAEAPRTDAEDQGLLVLRPAPHLENRRRGATSSVGSNPTPAALTATNGLVELDTRRRARRVRSRRISPDQGAPRNQAEVSQSPGPSPRPTGESERDARCLGGASGFATRGQTLAPVVLMYAAQGGSGLRASLCSGRLRTAAVTRWVVAAATLP
jgi:hypothetical protein